MNMRIFERNIMNEHGLVLIRNSDFAFDSIMKREADTCLLYTSDAADE